MFRELLLLSRVEFSMAAIAAPRHFFDDLKTAGFGFGASGGDDAGGQRLGFGGASEPDTAVSFLMLLGKGIEAFETRTQGWLDLVRRVELRQPDGEGHVHLEAGNSALAAARDGGGGEIGVHASRGIGLAAPDTGTIVEHGFEQALCRGARNEIMHVARRGLGACLRPEAKNQRGQNGPC